MFHFFERWDKINRKINQKYAKIEPSSRKYLVIRGLIDMQVTDLIRHTKSMIGKCKIRSYSDLHKLDRKLVGFSGEIRELRKPFRKFLMQKLYHHYRVMRMSIKAKRFIREFVLRICRAPAAAAFRSPSYDSERRSKAGSLRLHSRHDRPLRVR